MGATEDVFRSRVRRWSLPAARPDLRGWLRARLAIEADARTWFHLLPIGLMLGIVAVYGLGWRPLPIGWAVGAGALLAAWPLVSGAGSRALLALFGMALAGAGLAGLELARNDAVIFSGEATVRIEGRVLWRDRDERERMRYLVSIDRTERPVLSRPPGRAEILVSSKHAPIEVGGTYRGLVRLRAPSGPALPGGYDFAFGAFFERLGAYGFALGPPDPRPADEPVALSAAEWLVDLRLSIGDRIRGVIGGAAGAVASAIVTGERTGIPDDVDLWLRATGLSHVLSISGLHMALVVGFAMTLVRVACAAVPALALHLPSKKIAAAAALSVAAFYLALSGVDVAATRSFVMIAIMLTAVVFDRSALTLRNISIAALIVLAATPHALMTASFQMSFGATAAIVAAYGSYGRWKARREDGGGAGRGIAVVAVLWLLGIAASSLVAGLATAPFAAFHFQRVAPYGLAANMLALPIFSFWIMPLALIAMVAMPFGLDGPFLWLLGQGLSLVFVIARFLYERLPDNPTGLLTTGGLALMTVALIVSCFLSSGLRWFAVPVAVAGLIAAPDRSPRPDLLVFEDGRELALIGRRGDLVPLKERPNGFVFEQWLRAYPVSGKPREAASAGFACETMADFPEPDGQATPRKRRYCRAVLRSGLRVVWTDDYRETERACGEGDLAIVARAIRLEECPRGAMLVTLRTLRRTGSLAVRRAPDGTPLLSTAMEEPRMAEWNLHRLAPWPEAWRKPVPAAERDPAAAP